MAARLGGSISTNREFAAGRTSLTSLSTCLLRDRTPCPGAGVRRHSDQRAHSTQRRVAGRATSRSNPIWSAHCSQAPNSLSSRSASVRWSAAASRIAWLCRALTCARSNAIVVPSGSCSSSVFDISAAATMSSNCRASDTACSSVRPNSATSAERIVRRSRSVSPRIRGIHHAYTRKRLRKPRRQSTAVRAWVACRASAARCRAVVSQHQVLLTVEELADGAELAGATLSGRISTGVRS
jgi:hypothetical protein